jgi:hypothetical protein
VLGKVSERRTPSFSQTDFSFTHEAHVSKTNEAMTARFEANIFNLFNQKSPLDYNSKLIANSGGSVIHPYACNRAGANCSDPASVNAGFNYGSVLAGYNYINEANLPVPLNKTPLILNGQYGQPYLWQNGRSVRFKVAFTF